MIHLVSFTPEFFEQCPEVPELLKEYSDECAIIGMPEPSYKIEQYKALYQAGVLHCMGGFDNEKLVGFIVVLISQLPHYGVCPAIVESFFVKDMYRKQGIGIYLEDWAEDLAKEHKCPGIFITAPNGSKLNRMLSLTKEFKLTNNVYFKSLV